MAKISERDLRLLTAYVDGELSARQHRMLMRLLRRSEIARTMLRDLQQDSQELRSLTRLKLPKDFHERVLQTLALNNITRPMVRPSVSRPTAPSWWTYAAAAALLLSVGVLAYTFFTKVMTAPHHGDAVADRSNDEPSVAKQGSSSSEQVPDASKSSEEPREVEHGTLELAKLLNDLPAEKPIPEDQMSKNFGSPTTDRGIRDFSALKEADVIHPLIKELRGLKSADVIEKLKQERSVRVDFSCKDGTAACQRLKSVVSGSGISLITEQVAEYRLKQPKLDTNYVMYLEDLTPDELAKILEALGKNDGRADSSKSSEPLFGGLVLARMTDTDATELKKLFGDYGKLLHVRLTTGSGSGSLDPKKSISTTTPDEILQAPPRPDKASAKAERLGLILPYNPVRPQQRSAEVRKFIETRKQPRPDTLQVVLVLHDVAR